MSFTLPHPHPDSLSHLQKEDKDSDLGYMTSEKAYRIVLAGDAAVGKSSFLLRLCKNEFKLNSSATLGELDVASYYCDEKSGFLFSSTS